MTNQDNSCHVLARIVRQNATEEKAAPIIQILGPWRLFLDRQGDQPVYADDAVDFEKLLALPSPPRYAILSATDIIICVVGPPNASEANIRVRWGNEPGTLTVVSVMHGNTYRVQDCVPSTDGWMTGVLPLTSPGPPPRPGFRGPWTAIEVHTKIDLRQQQGLYMRLEHHFAGRVPLPACWNRRAAGGYGAANPDTTQSQAQAVMAWQFAVRVVLRDSGWGRKLLERHQAFVKLMGFETNNPLHDDHGGRGAHWHLAVRGGAVGDQTPHLYLRPDGAIDSKSTLESEKRLGWDFGVFGIHVTEDGRLELAPITTVRHGASKAYLHVRKSLQKDRDLVALWHDPRDTGNRWMVLREAGDVVRLRSTRSGHLLHVLRSRGGPNHPVSQWHGADDGSRWHYARASGTSGSLMNKRSHTYLSAPTNAANRDPTFQAAASDAWEMDAAEADSSYCVCVQADCTKAVATVIRDGKVWRRVTTADNATSGELTVQEHDPTADHTDRETIWYYHLTGTPRY